MTDGKHDFTRWIGGRRAVIVVVLSLLVVSAMGIQFASVVTTNASTASGPSSVHATPTTTTTKTTTAITATRTTTAITATKTTTATTTTADAGTSQTASNSQTTSTLQTASNSQTTANSNGSTPVEASWQQYRTIVVFRNDDLQPDWRENSLRNVHRVFVEENVPLTEGVVPVAGNRAVTDSASFCRYLSSLRQRHPRQFEYALHGYTHTQRTSFYGSSEFGGVPYTTQKRWLREGKRIVTNCTGETPRTFVPPFNTYDDDTVRAMKATNFTAVSGGSWFTEAYFGKRGVFTTDGVEHVTSDHTFVKNWTTNAFYRAAELETRFDAAYRNRTIFVQTLHYTYFRSDEQLAKLRNFITYVKSKGDVKFTTVGRLHDGLENGTIQKTDAGWKVREPVSRPARTTNATSRQLSTVDAPAV